MLLMSHQFIEVLNKSNKGGQILWKVMLLMMVVRFVEFLVFILLGPIAYKRWHKFYLAHN